MTSRPSHARVIKDIIMVLLALLSIALLFSEVVDQFSPAQQVWISRIDPIIAFIFLGDFFYNFWHAPSKKQFLKYRWWEILAAIPVTNHITELLRAIPLFRLIRLVEEIRVLRFGVRFLMVAHGSHKYSKSTYILYLIMVVMSVALFGSLLFYHVEHGHNPAVQTLGDAVWYTVVTMATVGYGDIYPHTIAGRFIAVFLMFFGIGTLGVLIGLITGTVFKQKRHH